MLLLSHVWRDNTRTLYVWHMSKKPKAFHVQALCSLTYMYSEMNAQKMNGLTMGEFN